MCMHRPLSTASTHAAHDLSTRLRRLSTCGISHIFHLTTGFEVGGLPRVMSPAEIARMGVTPLGHPLPAWQCEEVLRSIPPSVHTLIDSARALRQHSPHLTLRQLVARSAYPPLSHVRIACGCVCALADDGHTDTLLRVSACFTVLPGGRLLQPCLCPLGHLHTHVHRAAASEVQVWTTTRLAHSEEKRDFEERNPDTVRTVRLVGGSAVDCYILYGAGPRATPNPCLLYTSDAADE